jgi:CRISPR-associated protein Csh1
VQYNELNGNAPFEKKLKGYNLSAKSLQDIYTEAFAKLRQFNSEPITLMGFVNKYFLLNINKIQEMSNNEASFYFVAGIQFSDKLKFPKEEKAS